jgi:hypothetical protein
MPKRRDIPPPKGYERHALDPNLVRKIAAQAPLTIAQALYPNLRSEARPPIQPKKQERK